MKLFYMICSTSTVTFSIHMNIDWLKTCFSLCYQDWELCCVLFFFFIYLFIESLDILLSMHNCSCRTLECIRFVYKLSFTNWFWMTEHTYDERLDNDLSSSCHYQLDQQKKIHIRMIYQCVLVCSASDFFFLLFTFHITFLVINDIYSFY